MRNKTSFYRQTIAALQANIDDNFDEVRARLHPVLNQDAIRALNYVQSDLHQFLASRQALRKEQSE